MRRCAARGLPVNQAKVKASLRTPRPIGFARCAAAESMKAAVSVWPSLPANRQSTKQLRQAPPRIGSVQRSLSARLGADRPPLRQRPRTVSAQLAAREPIVRSRTPALVRFGPRARQINTSQRHPACSLIASALRSPAVPPARASKRQPPRRAIVPVRLVTTEPSPQRLISVLATPGPIAWLGTPPSPAAPRKTERAMPAHPVSRRLPTRPRARLGRRAAATKL